VDVTKVEQKKEDEEAEDVDVTTTEKIGAFSSDSENELFYLPTVPERDPEADADFEGGGASGGATPGSDRKEKGRGAGGAAAKRKGKGKGGGAKRAKTQAAKAKKGAVRSPTTACLMLGFVQCFRIECMRACLFRATAEWVGCWVQARKERAAAAAGTG